MGRLGHLVPLGLPHHVAQQGSGTHRLFVTTRTGYRDLLAASCHAAKVKVWPLVADAEPSSRACAAPRASGGRGNDAFIEAFEGDTTQAQAQKRGPKPADEPNTQQTELSGLSP
jgi:hypothetical protein